MASSSLTGQRADRRDSAQGQKSGNFSQSLPGPNLRERAYRGFLFTVMLGFYTLLMAVFFALLTLVGLVVRGGVLGLNTTIWIASVAVLIYSAARIFRLVVRSVVGLLTPIHSKPQLDGIVLDRQSHPELFDVVDEVGRQVQAPLPDEIRVGHSAACLVVEQRRFGLRTRRRLTLLVGMPHLAVMTVTELKVIIAHELAHFRDGDTTLILFMYRFLESLRAGIDPAARRWWHVIDPLYWYCLAYYALFLRLSAPVQKQQEMRADAHSAAIYGGDLAAHTLLSEWLLARQFDASVEAYAATFDSEKQGERGNVYSWFVSRWQEFSPEGQQYLLRRLSEEETSLPFDTHPTMQQRIEIMRNYSDGHHDHPQHAYSLLRNPGELEERLHAELIGNPPALIDRSD